MSRRKCTVSYKVKDEVVNESIWIQQLNQEQARSKGIVLRLQYDESGNAVISENNTGIKQYQVSEPISGGAYGYVPVNAMKALMASGRVRQLSEKEVWVHLVFDNLVPSPAEFNSAPIVTKL